MKHRILTGIIALMLTLALVPLSAFADDPAAELTSLSVDSAVMTPTFAADVLEYEAYTDDAEVTISAAMAGWDESVTGSTAKPTDVVLLLDNSGSICDSLAEVKTAAKQFCVNLLAKNDQARIAVVYIQSNPTTGCTLTNDISTLNSAIDWLSASSGTNTSAAVVIADEILRADSADDAYKAIVIFTDGMPQTGVQSSSGPFAPHSGFSYSHCNGLYNTVMALPADEHVFTVGFLNAFANYADELEYARNVLQTIQNSGYFESLDINGLLACFDSVINEIIHYDGLITVQIGADTPFEYTGAFPAAFADGETELEVLLTASIAGHADTTYSVHIVRGEAPDVPVVPAPPQTGAISITVIGIICVVGGAAAAGFGRRKND